MQIYSAYYSPYAANIVINWDRRKIRICKGEKTIFFFYYESSYFIYNKYSNFTCVNVIGFFNQQIISFMIERFHSAALKMHNKIGFLCIFVSADDNFLYLSS